jgi:hypothetical protein
MLNHECALYRACSSQLASHEPDWRVSERQGVSNVKPQGISYLTYWVSKILVPHKSRKREAMWIDSQSLILRRVLDIPRPPNPLRWGGGRFGLTIPARDRQARPATFASTASCVFSGPDFNDSQSGGTRTQRMQSWRTVVHQLD